MLAHELAHVRLHREGADIYEEDADAYHLLREIEAELYIIAKDQSRGWDGGVWDYLVDFSGKVGDGTMRDGLRLGKNVVDRLVKTRALTGSEGRKTRAHLQKKSKKLNLNATVFELK